jgi:hypothetical protein
LEFVVYIRAKKHQLMTGIVCEALQLGSDARQRNVPVIPAVNDKLSVHQKTLYR